MTDYAFDQTVFRDISQNYLPKTSVIIIFCLSCELRHSRILVILERELFALDALLSDSEQLYDNLVVGDPCEVYIRLLMRKDTIGNLALVDEHNVGDRANLQLPGEFPVGGHVHS